MCGYGFGDQDILWAGNIQPEKIIGLNFTNSQVERDRKNVADAGLSKSFDLREGSATKMPIENESIDLVVSVESAFHYRTREDFFREAFRVLRPGGRLVTTDILPMNKSENPFRRTEQWFSWNLVAGKFNIPHENHYLIPSYNSKPDKAGFVHIDSKSIRDDVYEPLHGYLSGNRTFVGKLHLPARILAQLTLNRSAESVTPAWTISFPMLKSLNLKQAAVGHTQNPISLELAFMTTPRKLFNHAHSSWSF